MGILRVNGDFTHWHLLFYFLPTDERAGEKPLVLQVLIRVNIFSSSKIFLSSFKGFTSNRTEWRVSILNYLLLSVPIKGRRDDGWQQIPRREYSPGVGDVIRDMWRGLMTVTSHSLLSVDTLTPSLHLVTTPVVVVCNFTTKRTAGVMRSSNLANNEAEMIL